MLPVPRAWGEMSPNELLQFIGKEMVLAQGHLVESALPTSPG